MQGLRADTYRHKGMRKKLIQTIRSKGIQDERVLQAMEEIPRHLFLDEAFVSFAYDDTAFKIGHGQTISQPYTVAYQSELLEVKPEHTVLEIGTGSGYQACVLAHLCKTVYTIERYKPLFEKAKKLVKQLGYKNIRCFFGDGFEGAPAFAPYDRILITAAASDVPDKLLDQLKVGGKMVIPVGAGEVQRMKRITRLESGELEFEEFDQFKFVPMLKGKVD